MGSKLIVLLIFAYVSLPIFTNGNIQVTRHLGDGSDQLIEIAEQILLTISKAVNSAIEEIALTLREMLQAIETIHEASVAVAEKLIEKEMEIIHDYIEEVKGKTDNVTQQEVLQCIEDNEKQIIVAQDEAADYAITCISTEVEKITNETLDMLYDIKLLNDDILKEEKRLEDCKGDAQAFECVKEVINTLVDLALSLPERAKADADKAQDDLNKFGTTIDKCISDSVENFKKEIDEIYNEIHQCAENRKI